MEVRGECELLLTNSRFEATAGKAIIDFASTICCQLDVMKREDAIQSVSRFFETVFRFAENADDIDPTWGFGEAQGIDIFGFALKRVVLGLLPMEIGADFMNAQHFMVRDVGNAPIVTRPNLNSTC